MALCLSSETRSVAELTALAGVEPTRTHAKGDPRGSGVQKVNFWRKQSEVDGESWTLEPHWPSLVPIIETLASRDRSNVHVWMSIGTRARDSGYAFDLLAEHVTLLSTADCGVWVDSYPPHDDPDDRPPDYPYPD